MFYLEYLFLLDIIHDITIFSCFAFLRLTVSWLTLSKRENNFTHAKSTIPELTSFTDISLHCLLWGHLRSQLRPKSNNDHVTHTFPSQFEPSPLLLDTFFKSSTLPWKNRQQTASWSFSWSFFPATIDFQNSTSSDFYMARDLSWLRLSLSCFAA